MIRKILIGSCVVGAAIAANYAPLFNTHTEQDDCVFGPVSNEQYRQYLSTAKARLNTAAPSFYSDKRPLALKLDDLFENLSGSETNAYSRLAIMHATLRAIGAEYRNTNGNDVDGGQSDPYIKAATTSTTISFNYLLDVNRIRTFLPWPRDAWIVGSLAGPRYKVPPGPLYPKKAGGLAFIVNGPSLIDNPLGIVVRRDTSCPLVPSADLADSYSLKLD